MGGYHYIIPRFRGLVNNILLGMRNPLNRAFHSDIPIIHFIGVYLVDSIKVIHNS